MKKLLLTVVAALLTLPVLAQDAQEGQHAEAPPERAYVFTFITTGPATDLTPEAMQDAMQGHFANMQRLAGEGSLLIAGPLTPPKADDDHRGIFVFDAETLEAGEALAETDPGYRAGVFELTSMLFRSSDPLTQLPELEQEDERRRLEDPDIPDQWVGKRYIIATAPTEAIESVDRTERMVVIGTLDPLEADDEARHLVFIDAQDEAEARAALGSGADAWTLHGWYGSKCLMQLKA